MKFLRIIFISSGIITVLALVLIWTLYYLASNSLPHYQKQLKSPLITNTVTISRDNYAIPYIEAKNDSDTFFGLGYAHAQDRLWQMMLLRRIAQGRLSEIIGNDGLESDMLMRSIGIYPLARSSEKKLDQNVTNYLKSYADGINFYIKQISKNSLGRGSPEFFLFTPEISPWSTTDCIAILKLVAFQSTNKAELEISRTKLLLSQIKLERYQDLFLEPPLINDTETQTMSYLKTKKIQPFNTNPDTGTKEKTSLIRKDAILSTNLSASNIFAVAPSRSATGLVLAANDPHAVLTAPSNFMLVNMKFSNGTVIGGTIPGIPAIIIGQSKKIGWGISNAHIDDIDLFIEKLNPKNKDEYFTENGLTKFKIRNEIIKIKDEKSINLIVKSTKNGPLLPSNVLGVNSIRPIGHEISISWTGLSAEDRSIESLISIMKSTTIAEAKQSLPLLTAPGQNIMLVDPKNIEIVLAGAVPKRALDHSTQGKIPSLGWQEKNSWIGTLPFYLHPKIKNPKSGIIINTNNKITDKPFPNHISYDWGDSQRIIRSTNLLNKRQFHTVSSFKELQNDTISVSARILLPLMAKNLWFGQDIEKKLQFSKLEKQALQVLSEWNGDMNQNKSEPLIFVAWLKEFQRMLMIDDLGKLYNDFSTIRPLFLERVLRNKNGASEWCDIVPTLKIETCDQIAKRSFRTTITNLKSQFGSTIDDWRWGTLHLAVHKSKILGSWPILSFFTNIIHETSGGDNTIMMSKMLNSQANQFVASYGSTLRTIYDFSNNNHSLFIVSTGQSGHFLSNHYDDQSRLWQGGQYLPIMYNINNRQGGSTATTTIKRNPN